MLYEQLDALDQELVGPDQRWMIPALVAGGASSCAALLYFAGQPRIAAFFALGVAAMIGAAFWFDRRLRDRGEVRVVHLPDLALAGSILAISETAAAITDPQGALQSANERYRAAFGNRSPIAMSTELATAAGVAIRDGLAVVDQLTVDDETYEIEVGRAGALGDLLLWRFRKVEEEDALSAAARRIASSTGEQLADAGVLAAALDLEGRVLGANRPFADRIIGKIKTSNRPPVLSDLVGTTDDGMLRIVQEGDAGQPLRGVHVPLDPRSDGGAGVLLLFDAHQSAGSETSTNVQALLELLPIGLALVDRDGRFVAMNKAFRAAGGVKGDDLPSYPGDLVVKEDKAAVADAVRRSIRGPAVSSDLPVRLSYQPGEPVAMTVAGLRGLGDASVLLLLKDNSEEAKLKKQIAQATKMQAVGQLAGGVAHDFNNILTAIIGHCDLMLMRHTPGDSDYDDIQHIKSNSNRAAGLTRQLLAFSRQQTLRPQILQLPDVVSEVSHLLKRLLGETVELVVKHGRDLGPVRADPGQLEQVIVNLAVNARDAMAAKGGGTLTIHTYSVKASQVADIGSEILPVDDYSVLAIGDTGAGISANILGKIFEPFFTTKEVGKGTGLGLSTVYGIVKQSGGFIFADSKIGEGTRFTIYLPVHHVEKEADGGKKASRTKDGESELWGTGTILLVEDEPMVRTVAERALTRHGYKVLTANNGEEALEIIHRGDEIALMISDVVMPLMDGPTMVREARKTRPEIPILFMSGYAEEQLRKSIDIANVAFLPKPFSVQELAEAVRVALASK